jgi:hypothetical protein
MYWATKLGWALHPRARRPARGRSRRIEGLGIYNIRFLDVLFYVLGNSFPEVLTTYLSAISGR